MSIIGAVVLYSTAVAVFLGLWAIVRRLEKADDEENEPSQIHYQHCPRCGPVCTSGSYVHCIECHRIVRDNGYRPRTTEDIEVIVGNHEHADGCQWVRFHKSYAERHEALAKARGEGYLT